MRRVLLVLPSVVAGVGPAVAEEPAPPVETVSLGTEIGMLFFVAFAVLIALSVIAKLLIVFGVVPRAPQTGFDRFCHGLANVVGRARRTRSIEERRRTSRMSGGGASGKY